MPPAAAWLGALGAIPFVVLSLVAAVVDSPLQAQSRFALVAYGAVILSFLGGIHWGFALADSDSRCLDRASQRRLVLGVVLALLGWAALFLPTLAALLSLAAAFVLRLLSDVHASRSAKAPRWYPKLRWPLTLVVVASLSLGALGFSPAS
jgi:hypothetical protein